MRMEVIKRFFYTLDELSDKAKEQARMDVLERYHEPTLFYEDLKEVLHGMFPKSKLDVQFSLNSCQGDGLNIYGTLNFADISEQALTHAIAWINAQKGYGEAEKYKLRQHVTRLAGFYKRQGAETKLESNNRYCYSVTRYDDVFSRLIDSSFAYWIMLDKKTEDGTDILAKGVKEAIIALENDWEKEGYDYFTELSDDELQEICENNDLEFTEEGKLC